MTSDIARQKRLSCYGVLTRDSHRLLAGTLGINSVDLPRFTGILSLRMQVWGVVQNSGSLFGLPAEQLYLLWTAGAWDESGSTTSRNKPKRVPPNSTDNLPSSSSPNIAQRLRRSVSNAETTSALEPYTQATEHGSSTDVAAGTELPSSEQSGATVARRSNVSANVEPKAEMETRPENAAAAGSSAENVSKEQDASHTPLTDIYSVRKIPSDTFTNVISTDQSDELPANPAGENQVAMPGTDELLSLQSESSLSSPALTNSSAASVLADYAFSLTDSPRSLGLQRRFPREIRRFPVVHSSIVADFFCRALQAGVLDRPVAFDSPDERSSVPVSTETSGKHDNRLEITADSSMRSFDRDFSSSEPNVFGMPLDDAGTETTEAGFAESPMLTTNQHDLFEQGNVRSLDAMSVVPGVLGSSSEDGSPMIWESIDTPLAHGASASSLQGPEPASGIVRHLPQGIIDDFGSEALADASGPWSPSESDVSQGIGGRTTSGAPWVPLGHLQSAHQLGREDPRSYGHHKAHAPVTAVGNGSSDVALEFDRAPLPVRDHATTGTNMSLLFRDVINMERVRIMHWLGGDVPVADQLETLAAQGITGCLRITGLPN